MNYLAASYLIIEVILAVLVFKSLKLTVINHCGDPYLVRLTLLNFFGYSVKLHVFLRGDMDRELHDHPWPYLTWCILGGYMEEIGLKDPREPSRFEMMRPGQIKYRSPYHRHRVILSEGHYSLTLVFTGRHKRLWGFWRKELTHTDPDSMTGITLRARFIPWFKLVEQRRGEDC